MEGFTTVSVMSMTGFAREEGDFLDSHWSWELKSVNGRGLDIRFRLPPGLDGLEGQARKILTGSLKRGQVTANLQYRILASRDEVTVNEVLLQKYQLVAAQLADSGTIAPARADGLLSLRGVLEASDTDLGEEDKQARDAALLEGLTAAADGLVAMRSSEGAVLQGLLAQQVEKIDALVAQARTLDAAMPAQLKARFEERVTQFLSTDSGLSEERIAQEVSLLALKADIREELDRLEAHVAAARGLLSESPPIGRKMDFLSQEFNREANTICSKSADVELTAVGLELKSVIDQMREQIQNVE